MPHTWPRIYFCAFAITNILTSVLINLIIQSVILNAKNCSTPHKKGAVQIGAARYFLMYLSVVSLASGVFISACVS